MCDDRLLDRLRAGDARAFEELVTAHQHRVYGVALRMLGNGAEAEDVAQETFLRAYRAIAGFRGEARLSTWLYGIARLVTCPPNVRLRTPCVHVIAYSMVLLSVEPRPVAGFPPGGSGVVGSSLKATVMLVISPESTLAGPQPAPISLLKS